jgi:hypothetical protein
VARARSSRAEEEELVKKGRKHGTVRLGDLIAAAFDEAARCSTDPMEVSRLATQVVRYLVRRGGRTSVPLPATGA